MAAGQRCLRASAAGLLLLVAPELASAAGPSEASVAASEPHTPTLSELLLELGRAQQLATEDPEIGAPKLSAVLEDLHAFPTELAADDAAQSARLEGLLILARARLNLGDEAAANAALDEALRCAHGQALDAAHLGPSLAKLEESRRQAIGQPAPLRVSCSVPCRIYVDEREASSELELPVGSYRVTVRAINDAGPAPLVTEVHLAPEGPLVELAFGPQPEAAPEGPEHPQAAEQDPALPPAPDRAPGRLLPRWSEVAGLLLGFAAVGTGGALLAIDGKCSGGGNATGPMACDDLYGTALPGYALLGGGAALTIASAVLLGIDESRHKARKAAFGPGSVQIRF